MFNVGDKVKATTIPDWAQPYLSGNKEYLVKENGTSKYIVSDTGMLFGLDFSCDIVWEKVEEFSISKIWKEALAESAIDNLRFKTNPIIIQKEERSEAERLLDFFKASSHDRNAKW